MSPFMVFDRVPAAGNAAWLLPALGAAVLVFMLTFLALPAGWIVRRRFKLAWPHAGAAKKTVQAMQLSALAVLVVLGGWVGVVSALEATLANATAGLDAWLWLLQIGGLLALIAALLAGANNLRLAFKPQQGWWRKTWSVLFVLSALLLCYVALRYHLVTMSVVY